MKMCLAEALKLINSYEEEREKLKEEERKNSIITYTCDEDKVVPDYDFVKTTNEIAVLNEKILILKKAVYSANLTTTLECGLTISEALVKMPMISAEIYRLQTLVYYKPYSVEKTGMLDKVVYKVTTFKQEDAENELKKAKETLAQLQIQLDRANLLTEIEV